MIRSLLLTLLLLAGCFTLSLAQNNTEQKTLGQATNFAVLAATGIEVEEISGVTGSVGVSPSNTIINQNLLTLREGDFEIANSYAANAQLDARKAYNELSGKSTSTLGNVLTGTIKPGYYRINGTADFASVLTLDAENNVDRVFVFDVDEIKSTAPNAAVRLVNGAQAKNVFWLVRGTAELATSTGFIGNVLSVGNITLQSGVIAAGRMISLEGKVVLKGRNNLYLPTVVQTDVKVTKTAPAQDYLIGDNITYTITVSNSGPGTAYQVNVKDKLPAGKLAYVANSAQMSSGTFDAAKLIWTVNSLEFAETAELRITFTITGGGEITNQVEVTSKDPDPRIEDNIDEWTIIVPELDADLSITKTASTAPYTIGGEVTYTLTVANSGPYPAQNVTITDVLPEGLELIETSVPYNAATGKLNLGMLAAGANKVVTIRAKLTKVGTITNTATVAGNTAIPDSQLENNTDTAVIEVLCAEVPSFTLTGNDTLCQGETTVFTATEALGLNYSFEPTGGLQIVSQDGNKVTVKAGATPGAIKVTATDACGNEFTASLAAAVTPTLAAASISGPAEVCQNSTNNTFTASDYEGEVTYKWIATGGLAITSADNIKTVQVSAGTTGGTLSLVVSNGCFATEAALQTVRVKPALMAPATLTGPAEVCAGTTQTYTAAAVAGADSYVWVLPTGWEVVSGETGREITVKVGDQGGKITAAGSNECGTGPEVSLTVNVNDKPATPTITGENGACIGATLTYSIAEVADATGYTWDVPETWALISGQNTNSITVTVGEEAGEVTVFVTNTCGNSQAAVKAVAPVLAPAAPVIAGDTEVCENSQGLVYTISNPVAGATYTWALPQGWTFVGAGTGTSITVNATTTGGAISVEATNACGNSTSSPLQVNVSIPPVMPGLITDNSNVCEGLVFSVEPVQGASSYTWTVPSGFTITSGQGTTTVTVTSDKPTNRGTISVAAVNGPCSSIAATAEIDAAKADGNLNFPKAFSPNGDGTNDTWEVTNLEKFPDNEVIIFNRWGSEVYRAKGYKNDWTGNGLGEGTYFYKVRVTVCDGVVKEFTGYTTIIR